MLATELLDSKRFCESLSKLTLAWSEQDDAATAKALDEMLGMAQGKPVLVENKFHVEQVIIEKKKRGRPKKVQPPEPEDKDLAAYAAQADAAALAVPDIHARMDRFMSKFVSPALKTARRGPDGMIWISVPDVFEGRPLPSSNKTWSAALSRIGIHKETMEWGAGADGMSLEAAGSVSQRILKL